MSYLNHDSKQFGKTPTITPGFKEVQYKGGFKVTYSSFHLSALLEEVPTIKHNKCFQ